MPLARVLPSPARGVPAVRRSSRQWIERFIIRTVAAEPGDTPARLTVGATLAPLAFVLLNAALGHAAVESFISLTRVPVLPVFPLLMMAQMSGFMSRASTARFIAGASTIFLAGSLLLLPFGGLSPIVLTVGTLIYRGLLAGAVGVWLARALRRRLIGGTA